MAPLTKVLFIYKYNYTKKTQQINTSLFTHTLIFKSNLPTI